MASSENEWTTLALRSILIVTGGSRGDAQPYIALAMGLKNAGYNVAIMSNSDHRSFVEEMGIEFIDLFPDVEAVMKSNTNITESMAKGNPLKFIAGLNEEMDKHKEAVARRFINAIGAFKHDLLVEGTLSQYFGAFVKYKLKKPMISIKLQAMLHDPKRMIMGLPTLPFGLHKYVLYYALLGGMYDGYKQTDEEFKKQHGYGVLDVFSKNIFIDEAARNPKAPAYILQSSAFKEVLHPSAHPYFQLVGQCVIPSTAQQQAPGSFGNIAVIENFLAAGKKPIYCGWGSMTCKSSDYMVELVARALMHSGQRAIVLGGWANLSMECLRRATQDQLVLAYAEVNVLFVEKAPHEWLFPQVACTVHHGGAGTLATAVRAGVPTIITPVWLDQWDHAHLVNKLGIGIGMRTQFQKTTAKELGDVIRQVVESQTMVAKAKELGQVVSAEDGVKNAISSIEEYWTNWIQSGRLNAQVSSSLRKAPPSFGKVCRIVFLCVVGWAFARGILRRVGIRRRLRNSM